MNRKIKETASILLVAGIIAVLFSGVVTAVDKNAGEYIGEYKGVIAYSNGANTGTPYGLLAYQCVAYVKNFYATLMDISQWPSKNAVDYFGSAAARGLTPYKNSESMAPQPDDILGFSGGTYGHVAIIMAVRDDSVDVIEQNVHRNSPYATLPRVGNTILDRTIGKVTLHPQGWLRKDAWNFNTPGKTEGWEAHYVESSSVDSDGKYRINPSIDPWIQHDGLSLVANNYNAIEINMASNAPDGIGKIYFTTQSSPNYDENKHIQDLRV
jgi:surface antigen